MWLKSKVKWDYVAKRDRTHFTAFALLLPLPTSCLPSLALFPLSSTIYSNTL